MIEKISYQERELAVLEEYGELAGRHIMLSNGRMELLDANPRLYPAQQLDCYWVGGDPQPADAVAYVVEQADHRFPAYLESLKSPEHQAMLEQYGNILQRGDNIILVTNHGDTIDVVIGLAGPHCMLDQQGYDFKTGVIISKMISRVGYILEKGSPSIPAVDALKVGCSDIFLSFPRTDSMNRSKLFDFVTDLIDTHNRNIRDLISSRQRSSTGYLLGVAGSGSTDKQNPDDPSTYIMGAISEGTIKMMQAPSTFVLPMAVWLDDEQPVFRFCDLRTVSNAHEAHGVMEVIADTLNQALSEKKFVYNTKAIGTTALGDTIV
ncbi:hypothetical protein H0X10_01210 [Candidatus Saccharibacteria bacterium]|nr:hypothetical protein [Candidatus Saccharibacteria bacterium]